MGNQEFGSWIWKGIELGPEKWEMGTKSEFSSLKVHPQAMERRRQVQSQSRHLEDRSFVRICTPLPSFFLSLAPIRRLGYGVDVGAGGEVNEGGREGGELLTVKTA